MDDVKDEDLDSMADSIDKPALPKKMDRRVSAGGYAPGIKVR